MQQNIVKSTSYLKRVSNNPIPAAAWVCIYSKSHSSILLILYHSMYHHTSNFGQLRPISRVAATYCCTIPSIILIHSLLTFIFFLPLIWTLTFCELPHRPPYPVAYGGYWNMTLSKYTLMQQPSITVSKHNWILSL